MVLPKLTLPPRIKSFFRLLEKITPAVFLALLTAGVIAGSCFRVMDIFELRAYDVRFRAKPKAEAGDRVVLVNIEDESLAVFGRWPFNRQYHQLVIDVLSAHGAKGIGIDILFSEETPEDAGLALSAANAGNVYFVEALRNPHWDGKKVVSDGMQAKLLPLFEANAKGAAHVNAEVDADGTRRRVAPVIYSGEKPHTHLGVMMALDALGLNESDLTWTDRNHLKIGGDIVIPMDQGNFLVDFAGGWGKVYRHTSYVQLLSAYKEILSGQEPGLDLSFLKDKYCFIGLTATATHDINPVPVDTLYPQVGLHADVFNNILNGRFMRRAGRGLNLGVLGILILLALVISRIARPLLGFFTAGAAVLAYTGLNFIVFSAAHLWLDFFYPVICFIGFYLSAMINRTMSEKRARELIEKEMSIASRIQRSFLPSKLPDSRLLDLAAYMLPAKHVGGDLYAAFEVDDTRVGVMLGDVSGKGMPAALFMAKSTAEFKFNSSSQTDPSVVLAKLNDSLAADESSGLFVTMNYLVFDIPRKRIYFSNAGHMPVLRVNQEGTASEIDSPEGMPIALMPGVAFGRTELDLTPGEIFVLYTDGISEARNRKSEDYEIDRLKRVVIKNRRMTAAGIKDAILEDVRHFVNHAPQHDDMTVIVIKVK